MSIFEAAVAARVKKIIYASSASVYGEADVFPTDERHHPYNNRTLYGAAKLMNEGIARSFHDMYGLASVGLRYFNVYGPRMDVTGAYTEVFIRWLDCIDEGRPPQIHGDGSASMDFIYVEDIARANILAMRSDRADDVYNVASGTETTLLGLWEAMQAATGAYHLAPEFRPAPRLTQSLGAWPTRIAPARNWASLLRCPWRKACAAWCPGGARRSRGGRRRPDEHLPSEDPHRPADPRRGRGDGCTPGDPLGLDYAGAGGRGLRGGVRRLRRRPHACAVSSCTAALHLALHALGVGPDDEVVTVSHSFIATANAARYCGARPVFVDIDPRTYNMDPPWWRRRSPRAPRAILPVHQVGLPCDLPAILDIAGRHGLPVVEDAACAIGSELLVGREWGRVGRPHGTVACFSFHPRKVITTGDGGMITTRNPDLDRRFRLLRQHGMSISDTARHAARIIVFEEYPVLGFNYRMTDIQAAVGRVQLGRLPEIVAQRIEVAEEYTRALRGMPGLEPPYIPRDTRPNYQSYPVRVTDEHPLDRDTLMQELLDSGVSTRRGIMNAHQEAAYADAPPRLLPHSEAAQGRGGPPPAFRRDVA